MRREGLKVSKKQKRQKARRRLLFLVVLLLIIAALVIGYCYSGALNNFPSRIATWINTRKTHFHQEMLKREAMVVSNPSAPEDSSAVSPPHFEFYSVLSQEQPADTINPSATLQTTPTPNTTQQVAPTQPVIPVPLTPVPQSKQPSKHKTIHPNKPPISASELEQDLATSIISPSQPRTGHTRNGRRVHAAHRNELHRI